MENNNSNSSKTNNQQWNHPSGVPSSTHFPPGQNASLPAAMAAAFPPGTFPNNAFLFNSLLASKQQHQQTPQQAPQQQQPQPQNPQLQQIQQQQIQQQQLQLQQQIQQQFQQRAFQGQQNASATASANNSTNTNANNGPSGPGNDNFAQLQMLLQATNQFNMAQQMNPEMLARLGQNKNPQPAQPPPPPVAATLQEPVAAAPAADSSSEPESGILKFPCKARGMPADHNVTRAFLEVPKNVEHGGMLVCSYPACRDNGVKFLYCKYCKYPVSKRSFRKLHTHADLDMAEEQKKEKEKQEGTAGGVLAGPPGKKRKLSNGNGNDGDDDLIQAGPHQYSSGFVNPSAELRREIWICLLEARPGSSDTAEMNNWMLDILATTDPTRGLLNLKTVARGPDGKPVVVNRRGSISPSSSC